MDPQQCLLEASAAQTARDFPTFRARMADYRAWRARGGFEPSVAPRTKRAGAQPIPGDEFARVLESLSRP